jgi:hypothetical protein
MPLAISFGQAELVLIAASVAGGLTAFYQVGYGLSAFGVGPLETRLGLALDTIYALAAVFALMLGAVSFNVIRRADRRRLDIGT